MFVSYSCHIFVVDIFDPLIYCPNKIQLREKNVIFFNAAQHSYTVLYIVHNVGFLRRPSYIEE